MRLRCFVLVALFWGAVASEAGAAGFLGEAGPDTLYISVSQTVHLRFASELKYVNLGSKEILAKIVDGSKDFVAVRAREPFDFCTSLSCLESNGTMHSFVVAYREASTFLEVDTRGSSSSGGALAAGGPASAGIPSSAFVADSLSFSSLASVAGMPQELYHIGVSEYGIRLLCENVFVKDDVLYMVVSLRNRSAVSYELSTPRFAVESRRLGRRGLQYEKAVVPRASWGLGVVAPGSVGRMVFTFDKISLVKGQVFRGYFYEKGGARNLVVTVDGKDLEGAKRL